MEGVTDNLLQLEPDTRLLTTLVIVKASRRWKLRWEALLCAVRVMRSLHDRLDGSDPVTGLDAGSQFHALDRKTNTTLVLLAVSSYTGKLHSVASRSIRHEGFLHRVHRHGEHPRRLCRIVHVPPRPALIIAGLLVIVQ